MLLFDRIIFWQSKKTNGKLRSFLAKMYLFYVKTRNYLVYKDKDMFSFVNIELSRKCNRSCSYCPISKYPEFKKDEVMAFEDYKIIIDQLSEIGYSANICFTGYYEPLFKDDIIKFIDYAREKVRKSKIIIYTNGDFLDEEKYKELKKRDVLLITSLHDDNDGKNYRRILDITKGKNIVFKSNMEDYIMSTRGGLIDIKNKEVKNLCIFPSIQLTVDVSGDVILCFDDFFSKHAFGNVKEEKLIDIWKSEDFKKVRNSILKGESEKDICKSCFS